MHDAIVRKKQTSRLTSQVLRLALVGALAAGASSAALARADVNIGVNLGGPAYVTQPVYVAQPVYGPPPGPGYYGPPPRWHHRHWHRGPRWHHDGWHDHRHGPGWR